MKTPVEELIEELKKEYTDHSSNPFFSAFGTAAMIAEKYLAKEKEHILEACKHGFRVNAESSDWVSDNDEAEKYYKETFKK